MPVVDSGQVLVKEDKEDKPFLKLPLEKESKSEWINAGEEVPILLISLPKETFISASFTEEKALVISGPAYDIDEEYRSASKVLFYLPFFTSYPYRLKKPLPMIMECGIDPHIFIIGNGELNKYGIGYSKEEALKNFEDFIIADYRNLKESSSEQLSEDAKELLTLYDSYIEL